MIYCVQFKLLHNFSPCLCKNFLIYILYCNVEKIKSPFSNFFWYNSNFFTKNKGKHGKNVADKARTTKRSMTNGNYRY